MIFYISDDMTKQVFWTKKVLETFIEEGNLNKRQEMILRTRASGYTIAMIAEELNLSTNQINKNIAEIRRIYDATQIHSEILPKRLKNSKELFAKK